MLRESNRETPREVVTGSMGSGKAGCKAGDLQGARAAASSIPGVPACSLSPVVEVGE